MKNFLLIAGMLFITISISFNTKVNATTANTETVITNEIVIDNIDHQIETKTDQSFIAYSIKVIKRFYHLTGFPHTTWKHLIMILAGCFFIFLGVKYNLEPIYLIPIGFGILIGNIPFAEDAGLKLGIYESGSVINYLYMGVSKAIYPSLLFLGIGAMTDFSSLISNPKLMVLGAAAQLGIFTTFLGALFLGFSPQEAGAIGIIGGADGPTSIYLSSYLAPKLVGPIAIAAYSYMALIPIIQPPIMRLLTTKKEKKIKMKPLRSVSKLEKILFPIVAFLITAFVSPNSLPLLGLLFLGNLLKECFLTKRLAATARTSIFNVITILLGITIGAATQSEVFLTKHVLFIFILGALSFMFATAGGIIVAKFLNIFSSTENKINPLVGAAGVSAIPDSAIIVQEEGIKADPNNHLLDHAMAPNVAGLIGSAIAAGILLSFLS